MSILQAIYFLEIFANKIDDTSKLGDDANIMTSFRLKCACKFKIICDKLAGKMHPLPNCASGEWGPSKAQRHFGLTPISHKSSVVAVDGDALVVMRLSRRLNFHCKLKMNGVEDSQLSDCVTFEVIAIVIFVSLTFLYEREENDLLVTCHLEQLVVTILCILALTQLAGCW